MEIPIYVINLKSSIDRKQYMETLCDEYGLYTTFIEAVYGKALSNSEVSSVYDKKKALKSIGRELMLGEIGCALSHKKVYQKMIDENIEVALVLEDDVTFESLLDKALNSVELFPKAWELVLLGHHSGHENQNEIPSLLSLWDRYSLNKDIQLGRLVGYGFGTYGYLINQRGARKLLNELATIYRPIDHYTADDKLINVYAMSPTVVKVQQQFKTLIDENSVREEFCLSFIKRLLSKIKILRLLQLMNKLRKRFQLVKVYKK